MSALAAIHVARRQLGLDEDTYRAVLVRVTGKSSAGDMTDAERQAVVEEFRRRGFEKQSSGSRKRLEGKFAPKLQALWIAGWNLGVFRSRDDAALLAFVKRQTGIDHARFLRHSEDADAVIEALKAWLEREAGVDWSDGHHLPDWLRPAGAKVAVAQWQILCRREEATFAEFRSFVRQHANAVDQMAKDDWIPIMNMLGERIRQGAKR